jgi:hypothetical protein
MMMIIELVYFQSTGLLCSFTKQVSCFETPCGTQCSVNKISCPSLFYPKPYLFAFYVLFAEEHTLNTWQKDKIICLLKI